MEVVQFPNTSEEERDILVQMLREVLEDVEAGRIADLAIAMVERGEDGPATRFVYFGQRQFGALVGAVSSMQFDMHFKRYDEGIIEVSG